MRKKLNITNDLTSRERIANKGRQSFAIPIVTPLIELDYAESQENTECKADKTEALPEKKKGKAGRTSEGNAEKI